jgi:regulatory protein YycI of two-component signal transduction system YycFG
MKYYKILFFYIVNFLIFNIVLGKSFIAKDQIFLEELPGMSDVVSKMNGDNTANLLKGFVE